MDSKHTLTGHSVSQGITFWTKFWVWPKEIICTVAMFPYPNKNSHPTHNGIVTNLPNWKLKTKVLKPGLSQKVRDEKMSLLHVG